MSSDRTHSCPPPKRAGRYWTTVRFCEGTLGVTTYMGGGPSLMYAASAVAAFEEFSTLETPIG
jgi:hypothetical protein